MLRRNGTRRTKLIPFVLNDINGSDVDAKIASSKLFEQMPTALIVEFFNSGVDLLALGRSIPKSSTPTAAEAEHHVQLRVTAAQVIGTLLLYRTDGLHNMKSFCLAGWSLLADRILYDPSRRVFKAALEAVSTLCAVLYRDSRHRMNDTGVPLTRSAPSKAALLDGLDPFDPYSWRSQVESELAPLTPSTATATFAAYGSFSAAAAENLSVVAKSLSSLEKYGHVVFVKLLPHIYSFVNRCRWLDHCDLPPGLLLLSCLLQQLEQLSGEHSNIQVHFMTSPKHLIGEVVETFLFPLLYVKDEALVFESAANLIYIARGDATTVNPGWALAACRALTGLLSRETARSVIQRVVPVLIASLRLLSPGVLLPVLILTLQHVQKLQLPSAQRLPLFHNLISIPIQLCDSNALDPLTFFPSFFKHPWIASLVNSTDEDHFREDLMGTLMKALFEHWSAIAQANSDAESTDTRLFNSRPTLGRNTDSDSESSTSTTGTTSFSTRSAKRLSSSFQQGIFGSLGGSGVSGLGVGAASSTGGSANTANTSSAVALGNSTDALSPRSASPVSSSSNQNLNTFGATSANAGSNNAAQSQASAANSLKRFKQWREVMYIVVVALMKTLTWKTHVRTYCYTLYLNLVDAVGQALGRTKSARPQLRDMLTKILEHALTLKSDAVCLRYCYLIMKHVMETGNNKLVDALFRATQTRFLSFLTVPVNTSTDRSLGYRVDQLCKTNLSPADLEILVLLLHMFSKHPAICDPLPDDERGGTPLPNPKLAAALHYIESIKKFRADDPVAAHRYAQLESIETSHNLSNLITIITSKLATSTASSTANTSDSSSKKSSGGDSSATTGSSKNSSRTGTTRHPSPTSNDSIVAAKRGKHSKSLSLSFTAASVSTLADLADTSTGASEARNSSTMNDSSLMTSKSKGGGAGIETSMSESSSGIRVTPRNGNGANSAGSQHNIQVRTLPSALDGAQTYVPPIEYLSRDVAEKHPDDEFMIMYSKSRLPSNAELDATRQLDRPTTLTAPSDPFVVEAYHLINVEYHRVSFYLRLTNLTNFTVAKVMVNVDTKGRLEPFNAQVLTNTTFNKMGPGETTLWHTSFKLNSTHVNELMVRLRLQTHAAPNATITSSSGVGSSAQSGSNLGSNAAASATPPTLDIQCMPYRINMHVMTLPWIISYADYTREWGRYTNTVSFNVLLDHFVSLQQLDQSIANSYHRQIAWSYNDTYQMAYSGITWWDERVLVTIFGAKHSEAFIEAIQGASTSSSSASGDRHHNDVSNHHASSSSPYSLRFELRTSSPNLCAVVDNNREHWLRDLMPLVSNWFTFPSDSDYANSMSDPLLGNAAGSGTDSFGFGFSSSGSLADLIGSASTSSSSAHASSSSPSSTASALPSYPDSIVSGTGTAGRGSRPDLSTISSASALDERLLLDQWNKARVS